MKAIVDMPSQRFWMICALGLMVSASGLFGFSDAEDQQRIAEHKCAVTPIKPVFCQSVEVAGNE